MPASSTTPSHRRGITSANSNIGSSGRSFYTHHVPFIASYLFFGLVHELSHLAIAYILFHPSTSSSSSNSASYDHSNLFDVEFVIRALLGRYCLIELPIGDGEDEASNDASVARLVIRHFGWIFSFVLAIALHCYWYRSSSSHENVEKKCNSASFWFMLKLEPIVIVAAYVTAVEALTTDLFGFVPRIIGQVSDSCMIMHKSICIYSIYI